MLSTLTLKLPPPALTKLAMSFDDDFTSVKAISFKAEPKAEVCAVGALAIQKQAWHTDVLELAKLNRRRKELLPYASPYLNEELRQLAAKIARSMDRAASPWKVR
jgi:hypothetical protein